MIGRGKNLRGVRDARKVRCVCGYVRACVPVCMIVHIQKSIISPTKTKTAVYLNSNTIFYVSSCSILGGPRR